MKKFLITIFTLLIIPVFSLGKTVEKPIHIDVAFTIDNNYPIFTMILIDSILKNNTSNSDYTFWVVENNITDKNKAMMKDFVEEQKHQKLNFININTDIIDKGENYFNFSNYITSIGFARILLPDLLPKSVHKVLYLDSDMLATTDIKPLFMTQLDKNQIAGMVINIVQDNNASVLYRFYHGYFNSGMILMDLDKCRKEKSAQKMLSFIKNNEEKFKYDEGKPHEPKWLYPDQDVINIIWDGRIKSIEPKWNNQCVRGQSMDYVLLGGIIHYIGSSKPWDFEGLSGYDYVKIYYEYWAKSPFSKYRYYYFCKRFTDDYVKLIKKKIRRYKTFIKRVKEKSKEDSVFWIFYEPEKMKR